MIPKTIHYCWFGRNPKPKLAKKCIKSWKKKCPDYQIIEWNEDNFDISACPLYVRQAYEAKKWAFVTDYVRLKVVYDHGGIYLDTDVELLKNLDILLENKAYFGFQDDKYVATGLGFGAEEKHPLLMELMNDYDMVPFLRDDGSVDDTACPVRNLACFLKHGLVQNGKSQILENSIQILSTEYLSPITYSSGEKRITKNTISIHWYAASWFSWELQERRKKREKNYRILKRKQAVRVAADFVYHLPNMFLRFVIGKEKYEALKSNIKQKTG